MLCSLFGCTAQTIGFRSVEAEEFGRIIADTTQAVTRLDVRTAAEYAEGHIANAVNIDVLDGNFESRATGKLPKDKTVAVYCRSGNRSKKAAGKLAALGYTNIVEFGGINDWPGETVSE